MTVEQPKNPLHGITLEAILGALVERHGWEWLGREIDIKCFTTDPSIPSSLKFLRRTPWARKKVEDLYVKAPKADRPKPKRRRPGKAAKARKQGK
jgi:uncharacterized protein (DUF2132 family)